MVRDEGGRDPTEECLAVSRVNQSCGEGKTYIWAYWKGFGGDLRLVWVCGSSWRK